MSEKVLMKGNEAIAEAAIRAGCGGHDPDEKTNRQGDRQDSRDPFSFHGCLPNKTDGPQEKDP